MRSCLLCLLALFTTTALGSWQYHLEEESDSCDDEDFVFDEEGCLHCQVEGNEEARIAVSKRGRRTGENSVLKPRWTSTLHYFFLREDSLIFDGEFFIEGRIIIIYIRWTPEGTVLRLLRLCQEAEMVEAGLSPNNAMLYAFTSKMKKMNQKKFQNFPKIQRPRRRVSGLCFTQTRTFRDVSMPSHIMIIITSAQG